VSCNQLVLTGEVVQIAELRYTPAGIPLLSFVLRHMSEQIEADMKRKVECDVNAVAIGDIAKRSQILKIGTQIKVSGFLTKRSLKNAQLVLHLNTLEII